MVEPSFLNKKEFLLIYWMILLCMIGPTLAKKIPFFIEWPLCIHQISAKELIALWEN